MCPLSRVNIALLASQVLSSREVFSFRQKEFPSLKDKSLKINSQGFEMRSGYEIWSALHNSEVATLANPNDGLSHNLNRLSLSATWKPRVKTAALRKGSTMNTHLFGQKNPLWEGDWLTDSPPNLGSSPDCRRNRRKWELRMCLVWREKQLMFETGRSRQHCCLPIHRLV